VVLLLVVALAVVVPVVIVVLVGEVNLLPLGAVGNELGGVTALKASKAAAKRTRQTLKQMRQC
jgi:hypothetical protein